MDCQDIDINHEGVQTIGNSEIEIINPLKDYLEVLNGLFDFAAIQRLFQNGFRLVFDAMYGVTGPMHSTFLKSFWCSGRNRDESNAAGGFRRTPSDPNQLHAAELVQRMFFSDAPDMGAACDGDGDVI